MSIIIKDLLPSDITETSGNFLSLIDKINQNFDQIVINGGGPIGLDGPTGPQGIPGPAGVRGNQWFSGITAPTQSYNTGALLTGDYFINELGDLNVYYGGTGWTLTEINLKGPKGETGASGLNGSAAGLNLYKGSTQTPVGITLSYGETAIVPTLLLEESIDYPNYIAIEKRFNTFYIGDVTWASTYLNNFGTAYDSIWRGYHQTSGPKPPKMLLIQDKVDNYSNFLLSFGAYGLTSIAGATQYGFDFGGSTASTNFIDFINLGFTTEDIEDGPKTRFKLNSKKIPIVLSAGGLNPIKGETAADIIIKGNSIKLRSYYTEGSVDIDTKLTVDKLSTFKAGLTSTNANIGGLIIRSGATFNGLAKFNNGINVNVLNATSINSTNINSLSYTFGDSSLISVYDSNDIININPEGHWTTVKIGSEAGTSKLWVTGDTQIGITDSTANLYIYGNIQLSSNLNMIGNITANRLIAVSGLTIGGTSTFDYGLTIGGTGTFTTGLTALNANIGTLQVRTTSLFGGISTFTTGLTSSIANIGALTVRNNSWFKELSTFETGLTALSANIGTLNIRNGATFNGTVTCSDAKAPGSLISAYLPAIKAFGLISYNLGNYASPQFGIDSMSLSLGVFNEYTVSFDFPVENAMIFTTLIGITGNGGWNGTPGVIMQTSTSGNSASFKIYPLGNPTVPVLGNFNVMVLTYS